MAHLTQGDAIYMHGAALSFYLSDFSELLKSNVGQWFSHFKLNESVCGKCKNPDPRTPDLLSFANLYFSLELHFPILIFFRLSSLIFSPPSMSLKVITTQSLKPLSDSHCELELSLLLHWSHSQARRSVSHRVPRK